MTDEVQLAAETVATTTADLHTAQIAAATITFKHQLVIYSQQSSLISTIVLLLVLTIPPQSIL